MAYHTQAAQYGQCDSYFVESDSDYYAPRVDHREHARKLAKLEQRAMAQRISDQTAQEWQHEILEHMERMEVETSPDVNNIDIQTEIQWFMRPYLLDFLVEAHTAFQLLPETLFLAINLLDRYCSKRVVYKRHYQLVGCAALLIAAKYGDRKEHVPNIAELKSMCCSLYDEEMFTQMEWHVLDTLGWVIGHPTVDSFLKIAMSEVPQDQEVEHMALYVSEIALFHRDFVMTPPSIMARSSLALARCILGRPQPRQSEWASRYDPVLALQLSNRLYQPSQVLARKYASMHLSGASSLVEDFLQRQAQIARRCSPPSPQPEMMMEQVKPMHNNYLAPQTPQKGQNNGMAYGYPTPPITPEDQGFHHYNTLPAVVQRHNTSTPTPQSSTQQIPQFTFHCPAPCSFMQ